MSFSFFSQKKSHVLIFLFFQSSTKVLEAIFPRLANCDFNYGGTGGGTNKKGALCVLAPNALSEKIFVFLWFWYHFMIVVTGINLMVVIGMMLQYVKIRNLYVSRFNLRKKGNKV